MINAVRGRARHPNKTDSLAQPTLTDASSPKDCLTADRMHQIGHLQKSKRSVDTSQQHRLNVQIITLGLF